MCLTTAAVDVYRGPSARSSSTPSAPTANSPPKRPTTQGRWVKDCDKDITRRSEGARAALPPGAISPRLSLLLAGGRGSADSVSAAELVHPDDAVQGRDAREQRADQLAAGAHQARPVRQFPGIERRLGPLARTLLGHAAADLGLRANRQDGSGRQLRRIARQARRDGDRSLGRRQEGQARACPTICRFTSRTSTPSPTTRRSLPGADEPRHRSHRLLVRQRRDAVCPVGLSACQASRSSRSNFPPTSSAKPSTKPAAGFTASWPSARCCSGRSWETGDRGQNWRQRSEVSQKSPANQVLVLSTQYFPVLRIPSVELHRPRPDAWRMVGRSSRSEGLQGSSIAGAASISFARRGHGRLLVWRI